MNTLSMTPSDTPAGVSHAQPRQLPSEITAKFRRLRDLKASFGTKANKNEVTIALIGACILEGFDDWYRLEGALRKLDVKQGQIKSILNRWAGHDPSCHRWWRAQDGKYRLHETTAPDFAAPIRA